MIFAPEPLLPPVMIRDTVNEIKKEKVNELLDCMIAFERFAGTIIPKKSPNSPIKLENLPKKIKAGLGLSITEEILRSAESRKSVFTLAMHCFNPIPFLSLAAAVKDQKFETLLFEYFSALSPVQQRFVLPILPDEQAANLLLNNWKENSNYVAMATPQQKSAFLKKRPDLSIAKLKSWPEKKDLLNSQIEKLQAELQEHGFSR